MNKIPMTAEGFNRLREELKRLKTVDRPAIIRAIAEARDHGDLAENAEYHAARDRQSFIEGRVIELEDKVARAEVIDVSKLSGSSIKFGAKVTLADEETEEEQTFQIAGEDEADKTAADDACDPCGLPANQASASAAYSHKNEIPAIPLRRRGAEGVGNPG